MADRLIFASARSIAAIAALFLATPAPAQSRGGDPTRPPSGIAVPVAAEAPPEAPVAPLLQSVLLPEKGRPVAIIGGQQVRLGEMFGNSRLVKLTEREAVLVGPGGSERLFLTPGIEKTKPPARAPGEAAPAGRMHQGRKE